MQRDTDPASGLFLHIGNRLEILADGLIADWARQPLPPLQSRALIVESASLARWMQVRICHRQGVAMLVDSTPPERWLWQTATMLLAERQKEDPLCRESMQWQLHQLLSDPAERPSGEDAAMLHQYLREADELKRWQLAGRIAEVFDRYQYHRPEWIRAWDRGDFRAGGWQGPLWRRLSEGVHWHRVGLIDRFRRHLLADDHSRLDALPPRIDLFSLHALPRLLLEAYVDLAAHRPVHLWLLAPSDRHWADLPTRREQLRRRLATPGAAELWQTGHPLLTRWGRQGQVLQDLLLEAGNDLAIDEQMFHEDARDTLLARVQAGILAAEAPREPLPARENSDLPSIQMHICHSPMRECQVLRDILLHCLRSDPKLHPEDILVMAPEISRYAPYIEAVFGADEAHAPRLPFNLSDVLLADEHPLTRAFLALLQLPESRFSRADVLALLNLPEIRQRMGLQEEDIAELAELLDRLRLYWGLDGQDKRERFDLPAIPENTWQQAFQRILAGYALDDEGLHAGIAPVAGLGAQLTERAARLFDLLDTLRDAAREMTRPAEAHQWAARLGHLLSQLFGDDPDDTGRLDRIREALGELEKLGTRHPGELGLPVIRYWLRQHLGRESEHGRFYSGGVTFCALQPPRGVPFRIICVIGLQDQAFPRHHDLLDFDLMARHWRHGDPDPAQEDRYLFLETLLAARERLILSWTGRDARSNEPLQPSVVVEELREHLVNGYRLQDGRPIEEAICYQHPLQPFSARNFQAPLPSFDRYWHAAAQRLLDHRAPAPLSGWPELDLPPPEDTGPLDPATLGWFLRDPARAFVQQRLRMPPPEDLALIEEEPLEEDGLGRWSLRNAWLEAWLRGEDEAALAERLRAEGRLLHGSAGLHRLREARPPVLEQETLPLAPPLRPAVFDCQLALTTPQGITCRLEGRLGHYRQEPSGRRLLLSVSGSRFRHADLLPLWVEHLCLHAMGRESDGSWHLTPDQGYRLRPLAPEPARRILGELLDLYLRGQVSPLPFLRETSSACMQEYARGAKKPEENHPEARRQRAIEKAWDQWDPKGQEGERDRPHCRILMAGRDWRPDEDFLAQALAILQPLHEHLE